MWHSVLSARRQTAAIFADVLQRCQRHESDCRADAGPVIMPAAFIVSFVVVAVEGIGDITVRTWDQCADEKQSRRCRCC